jgi:nuclear pore complex protein Nup107
MPDVADHLWAQIGIVCEEKESMQLAKLDIFWEGNGSTVGGNGRLVTGEMRSRKGRKEREREKKVVGTLESLKTVQVADG